MKIGVNIDPSKTLVQAIQTTGKWGIDFVEIYIEPPFNEPKMLLKKASLIKSALKANNLEAVGHIDPSCDLGSPDLTTRAAWLLEVKRAINAAAQIGMTRLDVHAHSFGIMLPIRELHSVVMKNLAESFALLVETASPKNIAIAVENTWEGHKEFGKFISKVKGLHATLDIGHAFMHGGFDEIKRFLEIREVDHMHVHDATRNSEHLLIGEGKIPFEQFAKELKKREYNGTATMEIFAEKAELKKSLDKFREMI